MKPGLWRFPPNPETHGGSSWLVETSAGGVLIDGPPDTEASVALLPERASRGPGWIPLLGRDGQGHCRPLRERLGWPVLVREQEACLLPGMDPLLPVGAEHRPPSKGVNRDREGFAQVIKGQKARRSLPFAVAASGESPYDWAALALWRSDHRFASSPLSSPDRPLEAHSLNHEQS